MGKSFNCAYYYLQFIREYKNFKKEITLLNISLFDVLFD